MHIKTTSKKLHNQYSLKKYTENNYKLVLFKFGIDPIGFEGKRDKKNFNTYEHKLDASISRTRSKVFEIAICNNFDYFITLTLDKNKMDRYDLDEYIKKLGQFIRNYRTKTGLDIQYLFIPEKHEDGAWHIHGLIKGLQKKDLELFTLEHYLPEKLREKIKQGREIYNWLPYHEKFGWVTVEKVINQEAVSKYITKYINKCVGITVTELNKKAYYCSKGLKNAEIIKKGTFPSELGNILNFNFENDYLGIIDLNKIEFEHISSSL